MLADIGDMQSVADDLSTFSGHLLVCNAVLRRVTRDRDDRDNGDERGGRSSASSSDTYDDICAGLTRLLPARCARRHRDTRGWRPVKTQVCVPPQTSLS